MSGDSTRRAGRPLRVGHLPREHHPQQARPRHFLSAHREDLPWLHGVTLSRCSQPRHFYVETARLPTRDLTPPASGQTRASATCPTVPALTSLGGLPACSVPGASTRIHLQAKFCLECGARQALTCSKCRAELPGRRSFAWSAVSQLAHRSRARSPGLVYAETPRREDPHLQVPLLKVKHKQVTVQASPTRSSARDRLTLIWCIGSYSHLDLLWEDPVFARTFERLGETARLLPFDKRGIRSVRSDQHALHARGAD